MWSCAVEDVLHHQLSPQKNGCLGVQILCDSVGGSGLGAMQEVLPVLSHRGTFAFVDCGYTVTVTLARFNKLSVSTVIESNGHIKEGKETLSK